MSHSQAMADAPAAPYVRARQLAIGAVMAGLLFFALWHFMLRRFLLDDAYISFRYARYLAAGEGLTFNPGAPVEGYTNFLWTLLMAPAFALGVPVVAWAKGLSIGLGLLTAALVWALVPVRGGRDHWIRGGVVALTLMHPVSVISQADGLETPLLTALTLGVAWLMFRRAPSPRALIGAGVLAALAALTRPDGVAVAFAAVGGWLLAGRPHRWGWLPLLGIPVALITAHALWRHSVYGAWLPNTFYVKVGGRPDVMVAGVKQGTKFLMWTGGLALWAPALWWVAHRQAARGEGAAPDGLRLQRGLAVCLLLAAAARFAFVVYSGGAWMGTYRFLAPALPLLFVVLGLGLVGWTRGSLPRLAAPALLLICGALSAFWGVRLVPGQKAYGDRLNKATVAVGKYLHEVGQPTDEVAVLDAGAIPYFSEMRALDLVGLNDAHLARQGAKAPTAKKHYMLTLEAQADRDYVFERAPRWMVLQTRAPEADAVRSDQRPSVRNLALDPRFAQYEHVKRFEASKTYHYQVFKRRGS